MKIVYLLLALKILTLSAIAQNRNGVTFSLFETISQMSDPGAGLSDIAPGLNLGYIHEFSNYRISFNYCRYQVGLNSQIEKDFLERQLPAYSNDLYYIQAEGHNYTFSNGIYSGPENFYNLIKTNLFFVEGTYIFELKKIKIIPNLAFGSSLLNTWVPLNVTLKSKNSNTINKVSYSPKSALFNLSIKTGLNIEIEFRKICFSVFGGLRYMEDNIKYSIETKGFRNQVLTELKQHNQRFEKYFGLGIIKYFDIHLGSIKIKEL